MHYFLPLLEREGIRLHYSRTLDIMLSHDIADLGETHAESGIQKTSEQRKIEATKAAHIFNDLPRAGNFNHALFEAYAEYLGQETREARFVRALNGLETMFYVLSRAPDTRARLVGGRGYALEDYRERIASFCREFPPLWKHYIRLERLFRLNKYFADSRVYRDQIPRPEILKKLFLDKAPKFETGSSIDVGEEIERLLRFQHFKRELRFGKMKKAPGEHHDTVTEHVALLLFLTRYFLTVVKKDTRQPEAENISLRHTIETVLVHDASEAITGDMVTYRKTEKNAQEEWDAAADIASDLAPRAGNFNEKFWELHEKYELDRTKPPSPEIPWFVKICDRLEAEMYKFDRETRAKISNMKMVPIQDVYEKAKPELLQFPILLEYFETSMRKSQEEGVS